MTNSNERAFGALLYEALCDQGGRTVLTSRLGYAQIQQLKSADRSIVATLLGGSSPAILRRVESDSPQVLAAYMCGFFDGGNLTDGRKLVLAGLIFS